MLPNSSAPSPGPGGLVRLAEPNPGLVAGAVFKTVVGAPKAPGRVRFPCGSAILFLVTLLAPGPALAAQAPVDAVLAEVARDAARALCTGKPMDARAVRMALRARGVLDAQVLHGALKGTPAQLEPPLSARRAALEPTHQQHASDGACAATVMLRRLVEVQAPAGPFQPFDRLSLTVGTGVGVRVLVMDPRGRIESPPVKDGNADVELHGGAGRYVLQVMADGPRGPEVAAQWDVMAGTDARELEVTPLREDVPVEDALAEQLRLFRARQPLPALLPLASLSEAARLRADVLAPTGSLRHRAPDGRDLASVYAALPDAPPAARLGEVLAAGPTPALAFHALLDSPAHRAQLVDPAFTHAGLHLLQHAATGDWLLVVALGRVVDAAPEGRADVLRVLNADRRRHGAGALLPLPALEELAQAHAAELAARGTLEDQDLPGPTLAQRATRRGVTRARAQLYRAASASSVVPSALTRSRDYTHAAVGLAPGRGVDGLYVVVLLAAP